ncbi:hypothetical protein HFK85_21900 [Ralstonia pseudosolanacearum]|uniref:hypothetical protein n=1 Tax=Ralstonia pseudosolanacearum TaxID=1310165 RepID=UPI002003FD99|nr:hypothetical protein [Ralstonia pseudosolanacearum]MCK4140003.1 hypothetical protein [Ralstonia pseudosolanacearum]
MELLMTILIASLCGYAGAHFAGRGGKRAAIMSTDTKASAYRELLDALLKYEIACSEAAMAALDDAVTDNMKRAVSDAGNGIIRLQSCIGFMLPLEIDVAAESAISNTFGQDWGERVEAVRAVRQDVSKRARQDVHLMSPDD